MSPRGALITFEGGEGSGKSTQLSLLAERLRAAGVAVRALREPGGTAVGEAVRAILLDPEHESLHRSTELLLYEAARAQLVADIVRPALAAGEVVLCDRFYDSTTAYQGYGRELALETVQVLNHLATDGLRPDRTLLLDVPPLVGLNRYEGEKKGMPERQMSFFSDRMERQDIAFHERVRTGFLAIAAAEPDRIRVVDASGTPEQVAAKVADALSDLPALVSALGRP